jgi:hypothetical protein
MKIKFEPPQFMIDEAMKHKVHSPFYVRWTGETIITAPVDLFYWDTEDRKLSSGASHRIPESELSQQSRAWLQDMELKWFATRAAAYSRGRIVVRVKTGSFGKYRVLSDTQRRTLFSFDGKMSIKRVVTSAVVEMERELNNGMLGSGTFSESALRDRLSMTRCGHDEAEEVARGFERHGVSDATGGHWRGDGFAEANPSTR